MLNTWIVAWVSRTLPVDPFGVFDANIFHPHHDTLTYSEPLIVPGAMAIPFEWLGVSAVLTYNVCCFIGYTLTALAMYVLVKDWTGDHWAGLLAGALMAFNAHSMTRLPHLQAVHAQWLPLAIWSLDRVLTGQRTRDALWLGLWVVLAALTSGYLAVFVGFAAVAGAAARIAEWWGRRGRPALGRARRGHATLSCPRPSGTALAASSPGLQDHAARLRATTIIAIDHHGTKRPSGKSFRISGTRFR